LAVTDLRVAIYGMKEFELRDPDGYWLWFGQSTNEPATVTDHVYVLPDLPVPSEEQGEDTGEPVGFGDAIRLTL
jgi:hypothetical protein